MFYLRTLGGVYVRRMDGTQLGGGAAQRRSLALLSVLAAHSGAGMRREALLSLLWPDADPERGRHALAQSLYHIRRTLSCDDLFVLNGAEIRLNPDRIASDVGLFQAALAGGDDRVALEHYEGPFMDGFVLPSALEFDQWAASVRFRLQGSAARAMERVAARAEASEDWSTAIDFLQRLVGLDPLSAAAVTRLMRAMLAAGDRPAAFRAGQQHVQLVRQQLEMEPEQNLV
jgi:DNA-binding SARP family transcriptional activator